MKATYFGRMSRSRTVGLSAIGLIVIAAGWATIRKPSEPSYQGRLLGSWLQDLRSESPETRAVAAVAIRQIGTNAIPTLLATIRIPEAKLEERVSLMVERLFPGVLTEIPDPGEHLYRALAGFEVLGPIANPAIPELDRMLSLSNSPEKFAWALGSLGEEGIGRLVVALTNDQKHIKLAAINALGSWASNATTVAALVRQLDDPDFSIRLATAVSIERNESTMDHLMVPALTKGLEDSSEEVRMQCARSLGRIGPKAAIAVPLLTKLQEESSLNFRGQLRAEVDRALFQICSNTGTQSPLR